MMIGRRTFIQGTALVATAPVLADLLSLSSTAQSHASPLPGPSPTQPAARTDVNGVVFKIYGWDVCDDVAVNGATIALASADPLANGPIGDQMWISINQSWRTAWQ
jgi:hypothetical protein